MPISKNYIKCDNKEKYLIEKCGDIKCVSKIIPIEQQVRFDEKILETLTLKNMVVQLLVDHEGGIQEDCLYLLKYDKVSDYELLEDAKKYTLKIVPVKMVVEE